MEAAIKTEEEDSAAGHLAAMMALAGQATSVPLDTASGVTAGQLDRERTQGEPGHAVHQGGAGGRDDGKGHTKHLIQTSSETESDHESSGTESDIRCSHPLLTSL
jgi:hypothetical protein